MKEAAGFMCIVLLGTGVAAAQEITAKAVQDDVLVVSGAGGNVTAFKTSEGLLVTDTFISPSAARKARELIEKQFPGEPIRYVINTHYHFDHTGGNQVYRDALIVAHINNSDRVRTEYADREEQYAGADDKIKELEAHLAQHAGKDTDEAKEVEKELARWKSIHENYGDFELVPAPFSIDGGARIELGGKTFRIYYFGPGHTDGDIIILSQEDRVMVMGDLLFNKMVPFIDAGAGASVPNWIDVLSRVIGMASDFDTVIPGHGDVGDVDTLRTKKEYLQDLWAAVSGAKTKGLTLDQAKEQVTLEKYKDWGRYNALPSNIEACWGMTDNR